MRVIGLTGWSGAGKTTLVLRLIPALAARGVTVSTVKHAHHGFDIDRPGKDSFAHRAAGAREVLVASGRRWALMHELRDEAEPALAAHLGRLSPVDLVIVEGFKAAPHPKIEVWRAALGKPPLGSVAANLRAIAANSPVAASPVPVVALDDTAGLCSLILAQSVPLASLTQAPTAPLPAP